MLNLNLQYETIYALCNINLLNGRFLENSIKFEELGLI